MPMSREDYEDIRRREALMEQVELNPEMADEIRRRLALPEDQWESIADFGAFIDEVVGEFRARSHQESDRSAADEEQ